MVPFVGSVAMKRLLYPADQLEYKDQSHYPIYGVTGMLSPKAHYIHWDGSLQVWAGDGVYMSSPSRPCKTRSPRRDILTHFEPNIVAGGKGLV